jgi:hypothetical protein
MCDVCLEDSLRQNDKFFSDRQSRQMNNKFIKLFITPLTLLSV